MTHQDQAVIISRLRLALFAFQTAQIRLLAAHRRLKGLPQVEQDAFWDGLGQHVEATTRATALELVGAFKAFSAAGLVADVEDRHRVSAADRHLAEDAA